MIDSKINLLPEEAIEELHRDEIHRDHRYYLLAIVLGLLGFTLILILVTYFFNQSKTSTEQLLSDQEENLGRLNDLWNRIIIVQETVRTVNPTRQKDTKLHVAWETITNNLKELELVSFVRIDSMTYSITALGSTPEESTAFLLDVGNSLESASISLQSIQQDSDNLNFIFLLQFNE